MSEVLAAAEQSSEGNGGQNPWEKMAHEVDESREGGQKAEIVRVGEGDVFRIEGVLTEDNIAEINERRNNATYIMESTAGLTSDVLRKVKPEGVLFSVKGGLDYEKIKKYNTDSYRERTMMSPKGLEKAVGYFEHVESGIDPEWSDLQKAMYAYGCLADDFTYGETTDEIMGKGAAARGLNGIMYGELVCAGFAFVYQEMMNRQGIECHYANQKDTHAYNVLGIGGEYYGVDVTWDNVNKAPSESCGFRQFGHDDEFYERHGHRNYREVDVSDDFEKSEMVRVYDEEEQRFPLSTFTMEELNANYAVIAEALRQRGRGAYRGFAKQPREVRETYLPVDTIERKLVREADQDYARFAYVLQTLRSDGNLQIDARLAEAAKVRAGYDLDMTEERYAGDVGAYFDPAAVGQYERVESAKNRGMGVDSAREAALVGELNQQLASNLAQYVAETFAAMPEIVEDYEYDPANWDADRRIKEANAYTKMKMILRAKDWLVENGVSEDEVGAVCAAIETRLASTHQVSEQSGEES